MAAQIIPITAPQERAWKAYVEASLLAQRTLRLEDGMKAGRAYRAFLNHFLSDHQRKLIKR